MQAASREDVGGAKQSDVAAVTSESGGVAVAQHAVSIVAGGLRAKRESRNRLVESSFRRTHDFGNCADAVFY